MNSRRLQIPTRTELLVNHLCTPLAIRPDRGFALCSALGTATETPGEQFLAAAAQSAEKSRLRLLLERAFGGDDDDGAGEDSPRLPWEEPLYTVQEGIAHLMIDGPLLKGYDPAVCWWYGYFSVDRLQAALDELATRDDVSAVLLDIRSPGGVVTGIPETGRQIRALQATKLVVAFTDTMACSAAYWLGCNAHAFLATGSADVGSIGTYMALYDYAEHLKMWGIKLELIRAGRLKGIGVVGKSLTAEERAFLQADVKRVNDAFKATVLANRGKVADDTMQGQWFDGAEALARGLIDHVVDSRADALRQIRETLA